MEIAAEQDILAACRNGDAAAYRPLVDEYYPRAVRLATAVLGNLEDGKDVAQEAFVAAFQAMSSHHEGRPFYPWLRGILLNRARMLIRTRSRARARAATAATEPDHWAAPAASVTPAAGRADLVRKAMGSLDEDDRTLLVLKHVEGFTYDELAASLGIPSGTVMSRLYRARQRLRQRLLELDPGLARGAGLEEADR